MTEETNHRHHVRRRILKPGKIIINDKQSVIDCIVRNQSDAGARLKVSTVVGIPDEFLIKIMDDAPRRCRVVWKSAGELGIAYSDLGEDQGSPG